MSSLKTLLSLFFLVTFPVTVTCKPRCGYPLSCGDGEPQIQPPFRVDGRQSKVCGDSRFVISCNTSNKTVLHLSSHGQFFVRHINYKSRGIQIYDPDNCLPRRLLRLWLPSQYKLAGLNQDYTFLNCSSSSVDVTNISSLFAPISCMSSSTHTILATNVSYHNATFSSSCKIIATVSAPVVRTVDGFSYKISDTLLITWLLHHDTPVDTTRTLIFFAVLIIICIGLPVSLFFACFICPWIISTHRGDHRSLFASDGILWQSTDTRQQAIIIRTGLDDSITQTYRRILLDEKLQLPNPNDTTCSICLSEYRPTETLKIVSPCNHYFHAQCINPWLRTHTTCPVCRKSLQHSILFPAAADAS
ncbi:hypothetical protein MKW92_047361 [Papaver armeniacum]|nr:hypothetical protein MKW92_047361 [Papaver armeniacum]